MIDYSKDFIEKHTVFTTALLKYNEDYKKEIDDLIFLSRKNKYFDWKDFSKRIDDIRYEYQKVVFKTTVEYKLTVNINADICDIAFPLNDEFKKFCELTFENIYEELKHKIR